MAKTVVGLFSSMNQAETVKQALLNDGYQSGDITIHANSTETERTTDAGTATGNTATGIGGKISNFFSSLSGGDDDVHEHYASGVNTGGALLAVTVADEDAADIAMMLKQHGARDIDGNTSAATAGTPVYGGTGMAAGAAETLADRTAIPIVEESLAVGKREVDRGGVRVYTHVVERPVEADVTLREEHINVDRHFVDRPATAADFAAGTGAVMELNATGEEAVIAKTARVVEEVVIGKQATEHTEAIHDTVRKTEVDVENVAGSTVAGSTAAGTTLPGTAKDRF